MDAYKRVFSTVNSLSYAYMLQNLLVMSSSYKTKV